VAAAGYFASYQIGQVEEVISFAPHEVADSIEAASVVAFPLAMQHLTPEDGAVHVPQMVDVMWRSSMGLVEYFVRRKHGLPMNPPLQAVPAHHRAPDQAGPIQQDRGREAHVVSDALRAVCRSPACPPITTGSRSPDIAPTDTLRPADWNPAHLEELIMQKEAQYRELGARSFRSTRVTIS